MILAGPFIPFYVAAITRSIPSLALVKVTITVRHAKKEIFANE